MRYLLDTNMCICLMKHQPPSVARRFAECYEGDLAISAITLAQLQYGVEADPAHRQQNEQALAALLEDIRVIPLTKPPPRPTAQCGWPPGTASATRWTS